MVEIKDIANFSPEARRQIIARLIEEHEEARLLKEREAKKPTKYGNKKTVVDGIEFASKWEAERYVTLRTMELAGIISDLRLQVPFELIPAQKRRDGTTERACSYVADFVYRDRAGAEIVEDTKGVETKEFRIKRKLMLYVHGIEIREVKRGDWR